MTDPGLDLHEWETRWSDLQDQAADAPDEALPEVVRLVEEMLTDRGFDLENPVVVEDESRDIVSDFLAARDIARAAEATKLDQEDIQTALEDLAEIHDYLVEDRPGP
jgi:alkyl sulfatase BDS1-like metallo-beta-lactamase superfamily hydrolase